MTEPKWPRPPDSTAATLINIAIGDPDEATAANRRLLRHYLIRGYVLPEYRDIAERTIECLKRQDRVGYQHEDQSPDHLIESPFESVARRQQAAHRRRQG